ncbi:MAG: hypothetical protein M3P01_05760 [Actinomycetota bacterium]|nr:hypothetical protein [Actinomycetota bacterium]
MRTQVRAHRIHIGIALAALLFVSCAGSVGSANGTVVMIPGYNGHAVAQVQPQGYPVPRTTIRVTLSETDSQHMAITLSQAFAPAGKVSFIVTNQGAQTHEFVTLATKTLAAKFPIVSFEGEANRINEDAKGVTNVGETGDMKPGTSKMLTIDMAAGHYAVVCNLPGHYAMGMHQDFWVSPTIV